MQDTNLCRKFMTNLRKEVYLYTSALKKLPLKVEIFSNFW